MFINRCFLGLVPDRWQFGRLKLGLVAAALMTSWCGTLQGQEKGAEKPRQNQPPQLQSDAAPKPASISISLAPEDGQPAAVATNDPAGKGTEQLDREQQFATQMTGATLVGRFTIVGQDADKMPSEEYTISKCEKLPEADMYRFTARIKYGEIDTELPLDLPVLWAGDTPVITLTNMWIPGMGTFSSRVMIYRDFYAGTWQHDAVGGHMFGTIRRSENAAGEPAEKPAEKPAGNVLPAKPVTISN
jgi:hypothetical protein